MNPVRTPATNRVLGAPGCFDLPVTIREVDVEGDGQKVCIESCWELTPEELATVNRTGKVYLQTYGPRTPPVNLSVECRLPICGSCTYYEPEERCGLPGSETASTGRFTPACSSHEEKE